MKSPFTVRVSAWALAFAFCGRCSRADKGETTPIPPSITTPDSVETRIGTLEFFDGFRDEVTVVLLPRSPRLSEVHFDWT